MSGEVCETCGVEKIGNRCLTRWCEDRHESVDQVLGPDIEFTEGERYELDELPEMDSPSGKLELVGDGKLGAKYKDYYLTFEFATVECIDVTHRGEIISELE